MYIAMQCVKEFLVIATFLQLVASYPFTEEYLEANRAPKLSQFANNEYTRIGGRNPNRQDLDPHIAQPRPTYANFGTSYTANKEGGISKETQFSRSGHLRQNAERTNLAYHEYKNQESIQQRRRDNEDLIRNQPTSIPGLKQPVQEALGQSLRNQISNPIRGIKQNYPDSNTVAEPVLNSVSIQNPFEPVNEFEKVKQIYPIRQQYHPQEQRLHMTPPIGSIEHVLSNAYNSKFVKKPSTVPESNKYDQYTHPNTAMINHKIQNTPHGINLKDLISTNPAIKNVLESNKHQKRYLVIHPNGEVEHVDELKSIVDHHPNYILVNGGTLNIEEANAPAEIKPDIELQSATSKSSNTEKQNLNPDISYATAATSQGISQTTVSPYALIDSFGTETYRVNPHEMVGSQNSDNMTETASNTDVTVTTKDTPIKVTKLEPTSETTSLQESETAIATDSSPEPYLQKDETQKNITSSSTKPFQTEFRYEITSSPQTLAILKELNSSNKLKVESGDGNIVLPEVVAKQETNYPITTEASPESEVLYEVVSPPETLAVFADYQKDSTSEATVAIDTLPQYETVLPLATDIPRNIVASSETASPENAILFETLSVSKPPQTPKTLNVTVASESYTTIKYAELSMPSSILSVNKNATSKAIVNDNSSEIRKSTSSTSTKAAASTSSEDRLSPECETIPLTSSDTETENDVSCEETSPVTITSSKRDIADSNTDCVALTAADSTSNFDSSAITTASASNSKSSVKNDQSSYKTLESKENINADDSKTSTKPIIFRTTETEFWNELFGDEPVNVIYFFHVTSKSNKNDADYEESTVHFNDN